jgi:hypothetical protein
MPRIIVTSDEGPHQDAVVLLDEQVHSAHLSEDHPAMQFVERVGWAISDAEDAERDPRGRRSSPEPAGRVRESAAGGRRRGRLPFAQRARRARQVARLVPLNNA